MSRCFPFPPPGYEKKARSDEADALKKESQKEKKHKKEKKDKEKRDSKEKKEKDRSDEKRREKKDKKEKHRDKKEKKKDRDKDKGKDKNGFSEEKRVSGSFEGPPDKGESSNEKKFLGRYDPHSGEKVIQKERENGADRNNTSGEKKVVGQFSAHSGVKLNENSFPAADVRDSKFMQDFQSRIGGGDIEMGNKLLSKDSKRGEGIVRMSTATTRIVEEGMGMAKGKKGVEQKLEFPSIKDDTRSSQNITARMVPSRMPPLVEKNVEKILNNHTIKEKEGDAKMVPPVMRQPVDIDVKKTLNKVKIKEKEGDDKHVKVREELKKGQRKDKIRDKEKKKEEKNKVKDQHTKSEKDTIKALNKDNLPVTHNKQTLHLPVDNNKDISEQNAKKRKDLVTNGFAHDIGTKPNKLPRPTFFSPLKENNKQPDGNSSSHSLLGNGKLETHQTSSPIIADKPLAAANSSPAIKKELKPNGAIVSQAVSTAKRSSSQMNQNHEVLKPPHPDSKYLKEVLLVPKMEDICHEFDDQDWLFHSTSESNMPMVRSSCEDEIPLVWAEAVPIESVDICALPYVIPY